MQELMKLPNTEHRVSAVCGNLNVADIGAKRLPKRRLEQRRWDIAILVFCIW